jgi:hypothetical protein
MSDSVDDIETPPTSPETNSHYLFMFGPSNNSPFRTNENQLHPTPPQRVQLWHIFKERVHPMVPVLHIPSIEPIIFRSMQEISRLSPATEALTFMIYLGAINSLSPDSCKELFLEEKSSLVTKYRGLVDAAFAKARLMETDDLLVLQAFVIYLVVLRSIDPNYSWTMTGLGIRLAQSLGLHREGSQLNLSKFEAEIRRRIWWSLCILDVSASEDHLCSSGL